jgi:hypothetical protein
MPTVTRRVVGPNPATAARPTTPLPPLRPQATGRPPGPQRNPVRARHRDWLGAPTTRARLRLRYDLLAEIAGLERGRGVGSAPPDPARRAPRGRPARLVTGAGGRWWTPAMCEPSGGRQDRTQPGRPWPARLQASPDHRRERAAARLCADRRQHQRHHPTPEAGGRDPTSAGPGRPRRQPDAVVGDRGYDSDLHRRHSGIGASAPNSPVEAAFSLLGWARIGGGLSGRCRGCISSGVCESVGNSARTCMKHS